MNRMFLRTRYDEVEIELNDTDTANSVFLALPLEREVNVWGGEIYFEIPVKHELENGKKVMDVGEVAFWPQGNALCIFFDRTPASRGKLPEAINDVTPIGRVVSNLRVFEEMPDRTVVRLDYI